MCPIVNMVGAPTYQIAKYLLSLLKPRLGKAEVYVKNSAALVQALDTLVVPW